MLHNKLFEEENKAKCQGLKFTSFRNKKKRFWKKNKLERRLKKGQQPQFIKGGFLYHLKRINEKKK